MAIVLLSRLPHCQGGLSQCSTGGNHSQVLAKEGKENQAELTVVQPISDECLEGFTLIFCHGIRLSADRSHADFLAQLLDELLVHGREAMGRDEIQA